MIIDRLALVSLALVAGAVAAVDARRRCQQVAQKVRDCIVDSLVDQSLIPLRVIKRANTQVLVQLLHTLDAWRRGLRDDRVKRRVQILKIVPEVGVNLQSGCSVQTQRNE